MNTSSLIAEAEQKSMEGKSLHRSAEATGPRMIQQSGELVRIANQVMSANILSKDEAQAAFDAGYRSRLTDCSWPVQNLQGYVNQPIWANMVGCALEGMEHICSHRQPNGEWKLAEYELDVVADNIKIAARWVDLKNAPDLLYQNGVPNVNVQVQSSLPPEILELIKARASDPASSAAANDVLLKLLSAVNESLRQNNELMQQMREDRAAATPPRPKKSDA